jgi:SAM-dependent methyltransferase
MRSEADIWSKGDQYERYVGRWSRLVADEFVRWLDAPPRLRWLDLGCGTGVLMQTIVRATAPVVVLGIDSSPGFVAYGSSRSTDATAYFAVGDMASLPARDGGFDRVVSGLALNFVPDPARAVAEAARTTRVGGTVASYVWDYADGMQLMRYFWEAAGDLDPAARDRDETRRFSLCRPTPLAALMATALSDIEVRGIEVPTVFVDFDDYWEPFLGGQGPAPAYAMSLSAPDRTSLRDLLRDRLPRDRNGSIRLTARAWAVRGTHSR